MFSDIEFSPVWSAIDRYFKKYNSFSICMSLTSDTTFLLLSHVSRLKTGWTLNKRFKGNCGQVYGFASFQEHWSLSKKSIDLHCKHTRFNQSDTYKTWRWVKYWNVLDGKDAMLFLLRFLFARKASISMWLYLLILFQKLFMKFRWIVAANSPMCKESILKATFTKTDKNNCISTYELAQTFKKSKHLEHFIFCHYRKTGVHPANILFRQLSTFQEMDIVY